MDLFCRAGGVSEGLLRAGFDVVGVDIGEHAKAYNKGPGNPDRHERPARFVQADALEYPLDGFDFIWASPPCQGYIRSGISSKDGRHPLLIGPTRERLARSSALWTLENVPGSPLRRDLVLCGSIFGLAVRRHRHFELSWPLAALVPPCNHSRPAAGVYGHPHGKRGAWPGMLSSDLPTWSAAMGIDWMEAGDLAEAIPPAYAEWIGRQALALLQARLGATA